VLLAGVIVVRVALDRWRGLTDDGSDLSDQRGSAYSVAFSPDGRLIATHINNPVQFWDAATRKPTGVAIEDVLPTGVAFSPDSKTIAVARYTSDRRQEALFAFDTATRESRGPIVAIDLPLRWFAFTSDFTMLATAGNYDVRLWDVKTGQAIGQPLAVDSEFIHATTLSPDGRSLAVLDKTGHAIRLLNPMTRQAIGHYTLGPEVLIAPLAFSPDGTILAISHAGFDYSKNPPGVTVWNPATGQRTTISGPAVPSSLAFSPDGSLIATGGDHKLSPQDVSVRLWETATGQPIGEPITGIASAVNDIAFSPDGKRSR
jgi:WD40 repeat protein